MFSHSGSTRITWLCRKRLSVDLRCLELAVSCEYCSTVHAEVALSLYVHVCLQKRTIDNFSVMISC